MFVDPNGLLSIGNIFINLTLNAAGIGSFILTGGHFGFVGWVDESNNWNVYAGGWWSGGLPGAAALNLGKDENGYHAWGSTVFDINATANSPFLNQNNNSQTNHDYHPSVSIQCTGIKIPQPSSYLEYNENYGQFPKSMIGNEPSLVSSLIWPHAFGVYDFVKSIAKKEYWYQTKTRVVLPWTSNINKRGVQKWMTKSKYFRKAATRGGIWGGAISGVNTYYSGGETIDVIQSVGIGTTSALAGGYSGAYIGTLIGGPIGTFLGFGTGILVGGSADYWLNYGIDRLREKR
jgi:hypothetical protein